MSFPSLLNSNSYPLVLDTSVLINLHACRHGERILRAIPNNIIVPKVVAEELNTQAEREKLEYGFVNDLSNRGIITIVELTEIEYAIFHKLVSYPSSLDDGEAATISIASGRNAFPVIDERKGRARASSFLNERENPHWSLDIFLHPLVEAELGEQESLNALYWALRYGRMRIPLEAVNQVIRIIGEERAVDCVSLPGYRERFMSK